MADKKRYKLEDYGLSPEMVMDIPKPYEPNRFESEQFLGMKPMSPKIDAFEPVKQILAQNPNFRGMYQESPEFRTDGTVGYKDEPKKEDLTFGQRGLNQVNNLLLGLNLHNSGIGEFTRQAGSPIASGLLRLQEGMQPTKDIKEIPKKLVDAPLGLASATFGTFMTPFTAIRLGAESVGGETAGKISEISALLLAGGTPLVAGYFAAEGSHGLAEKVLEGTELDEKDQERILEATGLISFVLGHRVAGKTIKATNKKLQLRVEKYIDEILPENKSMKTMTLDEIKKEIDGVRKEKIDHLIWKDTERISKNQKEYVAKEKIPSEDIQGKEVLTPKQIRNITEPETKPIESLLEETPKSKTPNRDLLNSNKEAIKSILDEDPSISRSPRNISKKLTSLVEQGKLPKKVSLETIKTIADGWVQNRPKPKEQKVELPETPLEEIKLPNFYGKNTSPTVGSILKENPEFRPLVEGMKDPKEINAKLFKALQDKRSKVKEARPEEIEASIEKGIEEAFKSDIKTLREELNRAKQESLKRSPSLLGGGQAEIMMVYAKIGGYYLRQGARDFSKWSESMTKEVGEEIRPYLRPLWKKLQANTKIDDTQIKEWIDKNKSQFNLTLEKVEGKIIDPNSGLEGGARNLSKREGSVIQFNENTKGKTWYHEVSHTIYNKLRRVNPEALNKYRGDIETLIGKSDKPFSEQFADAFTEMYTNPNAPKTNLFKVLQSEFNIPTSYEVLFQRAKPLEAKKPPERTKGERVEKSYEWLEEKYDAPTEVNQIIYETRKTDAYKKLRDDGTDTWNDAYERSKTYTGITEQTLLTGALPKDYLFNKPQQIRIEQIALNKALEVIELRKAMDTNLSTSQAQQLSNAVKDLISLQAISKNNLREAARVMESAKRKHRMSPEEYEKVQKIATELDKIEGTTTVESLRKLDKTLDYTVTDGVSRALYEFMLSNPMTQLANIGGNLTHLTWELGTQMLTSPIQTTKGFFRGIRSAPRETAKVLTGEKQAISKYTSDMNLKQDFISPKSKLGNIVYRTLTPSQALQYQDIFFRTIGENIREQQVTKRLSKELKTTPERIRNILEDILEKGESKDVLVTERGLKEWTKEVDAIEAYARRIVFQQPLGKTGRAAQTFLNQPIMLPIKFLAMPFMRIAVNLTKTSLDNSPVALVRGLKLDKKTGLNFSEKYKNWTKEEKTDFYRRMIAGTAFLSGLMKLVDDGAIDITGDGHTIHPTTKELLYETGYKENSIIVKSGGKEYVIPYDNISPFNIVLGGLGGLIEMGKYKTVRPEDEAQWDKAWQDALGGMIGLVNGLSNQSFLQGTSNLISTLERGDSKLLERSLVRIATPNITSLFKGSADFGKGANIYKIESILDAIQDRMALGNGLETMFFTIDPLDKKTNIFGEDKLSKYRRFPIPREKESKEIAEFLLRNKQGIGKPGNPHINGEPIYTEKEYDKWLNLYKAQLHKLLNENLLPLKELEKQEGGYRTIEKIIDGLKNLSKEMAIGPGGSVGNADSLGGVPASGYVTTATEQTITAEKTFTDTISFHTVAILNPSTPGTDDSYIEAYPDEVGFGIKVPGSIQSYGDTPRFILGDGGLLGTIWSGEGLTQPRDWSLPDASGTIALEEEIDTIFVKISETSGWDKNASDDVTIGGTQTVTGEKTFSNSKTVFSGDSVGVRGILRLDGYFLQGLNDYGIVSNNNSVRLGYTGLYVVEDKKPIFHLNYSDSSIVFKGKTISFFNYTLPAADGTVGQAIVTDGSGNLSFGTVVTPDQMGSAIEDSINAHTNPAESDLHFSVTSQGVFYNLSQSDALDSLATSISSDSTSLSTGQLYFRSSDGIIRRKY
jgi:hypothetical protein